MLLLVQSGTCSITLLLPQDSSGALGYAAVNCAASQAARGLTCSDVLTAVHSFYQQQVVLVRGQAAVDNCGNISSSNSPTQLSEQQQQAVRRVELLGTRLMFEGLLRATQDPHSGLYEVLLA